MELHNTDIINTIPLDTIRLILLDYCKASHGLGLVYVLVCRKWFLLINPYLIKNATIKFSELNNSDQQYLLSKERYELCRNFNCLYTLSHFTITESSLRTFDHHQKLLSFKHLKYYDLFDKIFSPVMKRKEHLFDFNLSMKNNRDNFIRDMEEIILIASEKQLIDNMEFLLDYLIINEVDFSFVYTKKIKTNLGQWLMKREIDFSDLLTGNLKSSIDKLIFRHLKEFMNECPGASNGLKFLFE